MIRTTARTYSVVALNLPKLWKAKHQSKGYDQAQNAPRFIYCSESGHSFDQCAIRQLMESLFRIDSESIYQKWCDEHCKSAKSNQVSDFIVIRNVDTSAENKKFIPRFRGPYAVHKVFPNDR